MNDLFGTMENIEYWACVAAHAADNKKAFETVIIDVGEVFAVSDYLVITSGSSVRQVGAIMDEIEERVSEAGGPKPSCCLLYTSPSPRDLSTSRMPSSA